MAYPYFPATYGNPYQQQPYQNQYMPQSQHSGGLIWVQGVEAAKSYPVSAGQSILLMDSESNCFFIKTADASGMPLPLRVFDYAERSQQNTPKTAQETHTEPSIDLSAYVTRDELESRIAQICASQAQPKKTVKKESENNGE